MKKFFSIFSALTWSLVLLSGCVKNEFNLTFQFPKDYVGNYIVDYYAWDSKTGFWVENVASIQNGTASLGGVTKRPTLVYIRDASSPANSIALYVERGDKITISGDKNDLNTWSVNGNKISRRWSEWRNENAQVLSSARGEMTPEKIKVISDFIENNKSDKLSTLILLTDFNRRSDPDKFVQLWNLVDDDAKRQNLIEMCGAVDFLGLEFEVDAKGNLVRGKNPSHKTLILRSRANGLDTLRLTNVKSSIFYFYDTGSSERDVAVDSLKAVSKEFPDSTERFIATVALQPDSMVWINVSRRDSIRGVVCAWAPQGLADRNLVELGVARTPWFVVKDKSGADVYSGSRTEDAIDAFRTQMKK